MGNKEGGSIEADREYRCRGDPRRSSAGVRGSGAVNRGDGNPVERRATVEKTAAERRLAELALAQEAGRSRGLQEVGNEQT